MRRQVLTKLEHRSSQEKEASDQALFAQFLALDVVKQASTLFLFWGLPQREPNTAVLISLLLAQGKRIGLPRMLPSRGMEVRLYHPEDGLITAAFGIQEPVPHAPLLSKGEVDVALVPGVCYDQTGTRLGFGGGYYDRWLTEFSGTAVGLCPQCVLQTQVPTEPHDQQIDILLTELGPVPLLPRKNGA